MVMENSTATVNNVFLFILVISVILLVSVTVTMIYFVIRYNRKNNPVPENIESNLTLEIIWLTVPTLLVLAMFYYGWSGFRFMRTAPEDAMIVKATGKMWTWRFEYENGGKSAELRAPLGRPVKLLITSEDVIHGLYIPAFRIKEDAVPGMETFLWFLPDKEGEYDLFCSEYCGLKHADMLSKVIVMPQEDFDEWYKTEAVKEGTSPAKGVSLLEEKGCLDCHTTDGAEGEGPTFKGIFGKRIIVITEGKEREVVADEAYLKNSVLHPDADIAKGYDDIMPQQEDNVNEEELNEIINYLKELK